jgi:hypothetical protein
MKYIILWQTNGNDGHEARHTIVSEESLNDRLNEIGSRKGALGNFNIRCFELGNEIEVESYTVTRAKR